MGGGEVELLFSQQLPGYLSKYEAASERLLIALLPFWLKVIFQQAWV